MSVTVKCNECGQHVESTTAEDAFDWYETHDCHEVSP